MSNAVSLELTVTGVRTGGGGSSIFSHSSIIVFMKSLRTCGIKCLLLSSEEATGSAAGAGVRAQKQTGEKSLYNFDYYNPQKRRYPMTKRKRTWKGIAVFSLALLVISGCIGQNTLEGEERDKWIRTATPIAENILQSINNNDYQSFSKDFSQEMKEAMPVAGFADLREILMSKIGSYISSTPDEVVDEGDYITVYFTAKFEEDEQVTVRLVFRKDDPTYKVDGLWFDSPKLRE